MRKNEKTNIRLFRTKKILLIVFTIIVFNTNGQFSQVDTSTANGLSDTLSIKEESYYFKEKRLNSVKLEPFLNNYIASGNEYQKYNKRAVPGGLILLGSITSGVLALINLNKETHFWTAIQ